MSKTEIAKLYVNNNDEYIKHLKKEIRSLRSRIYYYKKLLKKDIEMSDDEQDNKEYKPTLKKVKITKDYHLRAKIPTPKISLDDNFNIDLNNP